VITPIFYGFPDHPEIGSAVIFSLFENPCLLGKSAR
jgi:hypothetical protein